MFRSPGIEPAAQTTTSRGPAASFTAPINAACVGAASGSAELRAGLTAAKAADRTTVVHVSTDPMEPGPEGGAWWDAPVAEVSTTALAQAARAVYETGRKARRVHLHPG